MADPITPRIWQQPTTTPTAAPTTLSFGNGETFDTQGNAVNEQAKTGLSTLGVSGNQYTGYVSPVVRSSTPFEQQVINLGNTINTSANTPPITPLPSNPTGTYNPLYDSNKDPKVADEIASSNKALSDRQTALQAERDALIKSLTEQGAVDKQQLEDTQKRETGTTNRNLLYLQQGGQSASAQAYLNTLEVSHQRELSNLTAKYNSAIQQAKNAYSEKDFALAQAMVKNASDIKKAAEERNQQFLDNTIKIHNEMQQEEEMRYKRLRDFQADAKDALDYATKNNIQKPVFRIGGSLFDTQTGVALNPEDVDSVNPEDVQDILPSKTYAPGIIGEYQFYSEQMMQQGLKPLDFNAYQNMDANRKRSVSVTNNYSVGEDGKKEIDAVKAIIDAHPGEWGQAATAIDKKLGEGAATRYYALLKANYLLPANARKYAEVVANNPDAMTLSDWNKGLNMFIQENNYVDPQVAAQVYSKIIPKPDSGSDFK